MNKNIIIILAGGFLVAVLVAVLVQATLSGSKKEEVAVTRIEVLVAAKGLGVGHEIRAGDLRWQTWPEDAVFAGAIKREGEQQPTEVVKGKLLRPLTEGQPVHMNVVSEDDKGNFLSANVEKGMRAVGVSVKSYVLADRLFRPGDFVDVLVTYQVRVNTRTNPEAQSLVSRYATETVIENVRVLAIDSDDTKAVDETEIEGGKPTKKKSAKNATVTLEVDSENAEKLVLADKMGDIGLALRSIGDSAELQTDKTTTDVGLSRVMTNLSGMNGTSSGVRIYSGDRMQEVRPRNTTDNEGIDFEVQDKPSPNQTIVIDPAALGGLEEVE